MDEEEGQALSLFMNMFSRQNSCEIATQANTLGFLRGPRL